MYMLTYIGGWINGLSIVVGAWVAVFTLPRIYKDNQVKIKFQWLNQITSKVKLNYEEHRQQLVYYTCSIKMSTKIII